MPLRESPSRLAELCAFPKPESRHRGDSVDKDFCPTDGVPATGPSAAWSSEMCSALRLVRIGDPSQFGWVTRSLGRTFEHQIETVESVLAGREDAMKVLREVLGLAFVVPSAEVQAAVEP